MRAILQTLLTLSLARRIRFGKHLKQILGLATPQRRWGGVVLHRCTGGSLTANRGSLLRSFSLESVSARGRQCLLTEVGLHTTLSPGRSHTQGHHRVGASLSTLQFCQGVCHRVRLVTDSGLDASSQYPSHGSFTTPVARLIAETRGVA